MFVTLFILLFVAQPLKGPKTEPRESDSAPKQRTEKYQNPSQKDSTEAATSCYTDSCSHNSKASEESEGRKIEGQIALFTGLLVLVTLILATVAGYQAWVSRNTAIRELRAYMSIELLIDDPRTGPFSEITETYIAGPKFTVKNGGKTPAHKCNIWLMGGVGPNAPEESYFVIKKLADMINTTIPAGSFHVLDPDGLSLETGQLGAIKAQRAKVYYWGIIRYRDSFKKDRWTRFRMESEWALDPSIAGYWLTMPSFTVSGNDTEET